MEILKEIIGALIMISLIVATTWTLIFTLLNGKKNKNAFVLSNIIILIIYMTYCVYGRINWSEYGNTLVWEFYGALLPIIHTILLLFTSLLMKKYGRLKEIKQI